MTRTATGEPETPPAWSPPGENPELHVPLRAVEGALLTPSSVVRTAGGLRLVGGAVYENGYLVHHSQRRGGLRGDQAVTLDPPRSPRSRMIRARPELLTGTWLYGGNHMDHFGHFLLETVTRLWPRRPVDGIVMHPFVFGSTIRPWHLEAIRTLHPGIPVRVLTDGALVERLWVPGQSVVLNWSIAPHARDVWSRLRAARGGPGSGKVFFSRSRVRSGRGSDEQDVRLDTVAEQLGLEVVHPQELPFPEQVRRARSASLIVGVSGSALHLSALAPDGTPVIELGDRRSSRSGLPMQRVIDDGIGRHRAFVPWLETSEGDRDIVRTGRLLEALLATAPSRADTGRA